MKTKQLLLLSGIVLFFIIGTYATLFLQMVKQNMQSFPHFSYITAETMLKNASFYLSQHTHSDGTFVSIINAQTGKATEKNNQTHQLLAMHAIATASSFTKDPSLLKLHKQQLAYIKTLYRPAFNGVYVNNAHGETLINDTAFAIFTLIDSPYRDEYQQDLEQLGHFLLAMQKADGSFNMLYPLSLNEKLNANRSFNLQRFGSGEAALACSKLYGALHDKRYLSCAQRAFTYYYPRIKQNYHPSFGSWHTIAYSQLYTSDPQQKYLDAIKFLSRKMIELQNKSHFAITELGRFNLLGNWDTSAEAVYIESLGYASRVLQKEYPRTAQAAREANQLGLQHILLLQINDKKQHSFGGIQSEDNRKTIIIDNNGHTIMALIEYLTREK